MWEGMDLYFGSVKFFKHLIVVALALLIAASVVLVTLLSIENNSLREQLAEFTATQDTSGISDTSGTSGTPGHSEPSPTTTEALEPPPPPEPQWPPEPTGDFAGLFPELYATVAPWDIELVEDSPRHVYLTFDDGPNNDTSTILNRLREHGVSATFFVIPRESTVRIMQRIHEEGHAIGVHSYSHVFNEIYSSVEAFLEDFDKARTLIYEQTGVLSDIFRFPGGSVNDFNRNTREDIIAEMTRRGFVYFDWNVDSDDVRGSGYDRMLANVPRAIHSNFDNGQRSIVLFHDSAPQTTWVIRHIIDRLQSHANDYEFRALCINTRPHMWS
jgi:peptidoglycan/xylan/chitin deacetylase (PgdA/CDA1 family)